MKTLHSEGYDRVIARSCRATILPPPATASLKFPPHSSLTLLRFPRAAGGAWDWELEDDAEVEVEFSGTEAREDNEGFPS